MKLKQGLALHVHHDVLVEYCFNYDERVKYIKSDKPKEEQAIRLKVFKILPKEAEKDSPKGYFEASQKCQEAYQKWQEAYKKCREAYQEWEEAYQKWDEASQKCQEAYQKRKEASQKYQEAYKKWQEAYQKWTVKSKDAFHKKYCVKDCPWNGKELVFEKV